MAITIAATTKTIQAKANQEKKAAQGLEAKATMDRGLAATTTVKADRAVAHVTTTAKVARPADLVAQRTMMTLAHPVDQVDPAEDDLIGTGTTTTVVEMTGTTTRIVIVTEVIVTEAIVTEAKAATEAIVTVTIAGTEIVTEATAVTEGTAVTVTTVETMAENGMAVARTTVEADDPTTNATAIARDQVIGTIIAEDVADHPTIADGATAEAEAETRVAIAETTQTEVVTLEAETTTATGTTITKTTTIQPMSMKQN